MYIHSYVYLVARYRQVSYIVLHLASIVCVCMMLEVQTVGVHIVILWIPTFQRDTADFTVMLVTIYHCSTLTQRRSLKDIRWKALMIDKN